MSRMDSNKSGRTTLGDVANLAGVSVTTVSLVLSNKAKERRISAEVHARVLQAASELDYAPNLLVRSIQRGRTHVLSFFNGFRNRGVHDLYMNHLSAAIETAAALRGYDILVHCNFTHPAEETYRFLNGGRADGLILFAPRSEDPLLPYLRASRLPTVLLNGPDPDKILPCVKDDMNAGMQQIADRIVGLGHHRIAATTGTNSEAPLRVAALQRYLQPYGLTIPPHWIFETNARGDYEMVLRTIMAASPAPTVLFCWHDRGGYTLLDLCEGMDIKIPEQLSLVGYDGLQWPTITGHRLTSVEVQLNLLAETAIEVLDSLIDGKEVEAEYILPVRLTNGTTLVPYTEK